MSLHTAAKVEADYVDLRVIFESFAEKKRFIIFFSLFTCLISLAYIGQKAPRYEASSLIQIQQPQNGLQETDGSSAHPFAMANIAEESIAIQTALIRSKLILEPVIKKLNLATQVVPYHPLFQAKKNKIHTPINLGALEVSKRFLKKPLRLVVDSRTQYRLFRKKQLLLSGEVGKLIAIPGLKIQIDQLQADVGSQFYITKLPESEVLQNLLKRLTVVDVTGSDNDAHNMAIVKLSLVGSDASIITAIINQIALTVQQKSIERQSLKAERNLNFLQNQLPILQHSLQDAVGRLNEYRLKQGKLDVKLQTQYLMSHLSDMDKQIEAFLLKKINLLQQFTLSHPFVIALDKKRQALENQRTTILNQLKKLPAADKVTVTLTRDVDVKNRLYQVLLDQIQALEVIKAGIVSHIYVLLPASTPEKPASPNRLIAGMFGWVLGFFGAMVLVLLQRWWSRSIRDPHWTEKVWHIKTLAIIPMIKIPRHHLATGNMPQSLQDSLYHLRSYIQFHTKSSNHLIALMALKDDASQSFIVTNLGYLLARLNYNVLILDLTGVEATYYVGVSATTGLSEVLLENAPLDKAILPTQYPHLSYLGAGKVSASEWLTHRALADKLGELASAYDFVLINTPPSIVLSNNFIIAKTAGINLLVVDSGKERASELNMAIKNLKQLGVELDGSIFVH